MKPKSKLKEAFALFQATNDTRKVLENPFLKNGKVCATEGHVAIFVDEDDCDFLFENEFNDEAPNAPAIIPTPNTSKVLKIKEEDFERIRTKDEIVRLEIKCDTCAGSGTVLWMFEDWKREDDCPNCDGNGLKAIERKTGNKTFGNFIVKSGEAYFLPANFYKLIQVQKLLGGDIELFFEGNYSTPQSFRIGKCTVVIMPCLIEGTPNFDVILEIN